MVLSNILSQTFYERYLPVFFKLIKFRYQILAAKRESISQQRTFRSPGTSEMVFLATGNLVLLLCSLGLRSFFFTSEKAQLFAEFFPQLFPKTNRNFFYINVTPKMVKKDIAALDSSQLSGPH